MGYQMTQPLAIDTSSSERAMFIRRTYAHLAGAILAFVALETLFFAALRPLMGSMQFDQMMIGFFRTPGAFLILMVAFMGASYLARYWATNGGSVGMQYAGLGLYVVAQAIIFVPLLYVAIFWSDQWGGATRTSGIELVGQAGILTMCLFAGLTTTVFITRKDFSFLGPIIVIASYIALGVILCAILFPGSLGGLGLWFSLAMIVLAAAAILYDTSNIMLHYRTDQHVAASLSLFASVALLFYYVLMALMQSRR